MPLEQSILTSTKKVVHIGDDDPSFDHDIITHINSAFSTLHQLGIGPPDGFVIDGDEEEWEDFIPVSAPVIPERETARSLVKSFVYLFVRQLFDPPTTSYALGAMEKQMEQFTWRLSVMRETVDWVHPDPPADLVEEEV